MDYDYEVVDVAQYGEKSGPYCFRGKTPIEAANKYAVWEYGEGASVVDARNPENHDIRVDWIARDEHGCVACGAYSYFNLK